MCRTKQRTPYLVWSSPRRVVKPVFVVETPLPLFVVPNIDPVPSRVESAGTLFVLGHNHTRIVGVVAVVDVLGQQIEIVNCQKKIPYESQLEKKAFSHWAG